MLNNAKNGCVEISGTDMDYISFGNGSKYLVIIPGLGDGLKTVKGYAFPMSVMYKRFTDKYRVFMFSRKNKLEEGYSTRDMAAVIGGKCDKIVTGKASEEIAKRISGSEIFMYDDLGHSAYEEAKDFNSRVFDFFNK